MGGLREVDDGAQPMLQRFGHIGAHRLGWWFVPFHNDFEEERPAHRQPSIDPKVRLANGKADTRAVINMDPRQLIAET